MGPNVSRLRCVPQEWQRVDSKGARLDANRRRVEYHKIKNILLDDSRAGRPSVY